MKKALERAATWGLLILFTVGCVVATRRYERAGYPVRYESEIRAAAAEFEVDPLFLLAVIKTESGFRPDAVSVDDACGLMQLLPGTFEWLQRLTPEEDAYTRADLFNPAVNIRYGTYFIARLFAQFTAPETVAAAYHAGFNGVAKWLENPTYSADGVHLDTIPYEDTKIYVSRVMRNYRAYQALYPDLFADY